MGKKTPKIPVDDYYMSIHAGVCYTPDEVVDVRINEKTVLTGPFTTNSTQFVSNRNLFGGDQKQGGISGVIEILFGGPTQLLSAESAAKYKDATNAPLTPTTVSGHRGLLSMFFRGASTPEAVVPTPGSILALIAPFIPLPGFLWGSNNPVIPGFDMRVRRASPYLQPALRIIEIDGYKHLNPAHMIYECCVASPEDFGAGMSPNQIDLASFEAAAQALFDEGFGVSTLWTRESKVEDFVQTVADHVNGFLFVNTNNGLTTLKLTRDDYTVASLPIYGPDELTVSKFDRKSRGEIVNSFTVTYKSPLTDKDETVTAVDEAGMAMQNGQRVHDSRSYPFIRSADLAYKVAERDLRVASTPLATFEFEATRELGTLLPGSVFILSYPEHFGTETIVVRVTDIDRGRVGQTHLKIFAIEDVFVAPVAAQTPREPTLWVDPSEAPAPLAQQLAFTLPYVIATQVPNLSLTDEDYPDVIVGILGDQTGTDTQGINIFADTVLTDGSTAAEALGNVPLTDRTTLVNAITAQAPASAITLNTIDRYLVSSGDLIMFGDGGAGSELVLVTGTPSTSGGLTAFTGQRGVLDTTPKAWPAGTQVWHLSTSFSSWDIQPRAAGAPVEYTLLPQTSQGILDPSLAVPLTYTPLDRPYAPSRPANVVLDGVAFGEKIYAVAPATVPVSWANRNRLSEDAIILSWTAASVPVEDGQETLITIRRVTTNAVVATHVVAAPATSFDIPVASFPSPGGQFDVSVASQRDGIVSYQAHTIRVSLPSSGGYGVSYGTAYGA